MSWKGTLLRLGISSDGTDVEFFNGKLTTKTSVNATTSVNSTTDMSAGTGIVAGAFSIARLSKLGIGGKSLTLADDDPFTLNDATAALLVVAEQGGSGEYGIVAIDADGVVTVLVASTNFVATDTDAKLCVYNDGGTGAILENKLGTEKVFDTYYLTIGGE